MKFLHLADLHLGKRVNDISMLDEQKYALKQALELVQNRNIDYILIAGDVFDRPIASISALNLFNDFLDELINLKKKVLIISGNHDSAERLYYLNSVLKKSDIFISKPYEGKIEKVSFDEIDFYLMPYISIPLIKKYFPDDKFNSSDDAFKKVLEDIILDKDKINVALAHQFVIGVDSLILSDSEENMVGGIDNISYSLFSSFDYTALGHLHHPQKVGLDKIRYAGSIVKYSLSEINHKKSFPIVEIDKNKNINIELVDIKPIHNMKEYRGYIDEFLDEKFYSKVDKDDYIHFILLDENVIDAKKKLDMIYPNIMLLEFDNSFTRSLNVSFDVSIKKNKTILEHFKDFYNIQSGLELSPDKERIVLDTINEIKEVI